MSGHSKRSVTLENGGVFKDKSVHPGPAMIAVVSARNDLCSPGAFRPPFLPSLTSLVHPFLGTWPEMDESALSSIASRSITRSHAAGEVIAIEGETIESHGPQVDLPTI